MNRIMTWTLCLILTASTGLAQKSRTGPNGSNTTATVSNGTASRSSQVNGAYGSVSTKKSASSGTASKSRTASGVRGSASKDTSYANNGDGSVTKTSSASATSNKTGKTHSTGTKSTTYSRK